MILEVKMAEGMGWEWGMSILTTKEDESLCCLRFFSSLLFYNETSMCFTAIEHQILTQIC